MSDIRLQLTRPGIGLDLARELGPLIRDWLRTHGVASAVRHKSDWIYDDAHGDWLGPEVAPDALAADAPICVQIGLRWYRTDAGNPHIESACTACGAASPEASTLHPLYEDWLATGRTPTVRCSACGRTEPLTDRDLEEVEVVAPLGITTDSMAAMDLVEAELPGRFGTDWVSSTYRL